MCFSGLKHYSRLYNKSTSIISQEIKQELDMVSIQKRAVLKFGLKSLEFFILFLNWIF